MVLFFSYQYKLKNDFFNEVFIMYLYTSKRLVKYIKYNLI